MALMRQDPGVQWLLASNEPAVRGLMLTNVLGEQPGNPDVVAARTAFAHGPIARALLAPGPEHVYAKWQGAFWRLSALVELGVPPGEPAAHDQLRAVLGWLDRMERAGYPPVIAGRPRAHALWHGHALAAAVALDWPDRRETDGLVERLLQWQWPDGGWNCDRHRQPSCSSVHETLGPLGSGRLPSANRRSAGRPGGAASRRILPRAAALQVAPNPRGHPSILAELSPPRLLPLQRLA